MAPSPNTPSASKKRTRRRRCRNCGEWFTPRAFRKGVAKNRGGGSPQKFCRATCRTEYNRNGTAFGPLRDKLPGLIRKQLREPFRLCCILFREIDDLLGGDVSGLSPAGLEKLNELEKLCGL